MAQGRLSPWQNKRSQHDFKRKRTFKSKVDRVGEFNQDIAQLKEACEDPTLLKKDFTNFNDLPLSIPTKKGLASRGYVDLTEIQKKSIPYILAGRDVLGAAMTGSGKTLAFLIPVLEILYKLKWTKLDSLGALIITPTRELAFQIFNVLKQIGKFHTFSAGLLIGGRDDEDEKHLLSGVNIIISTPGRLLSHMDQNPEFMYDNLQVLVLDEADRCLDEGFEKTLKAIIGNLPQHNRHTLLFSATQKKSLSQLAMLSLNNPEYISVVDKSSSITPENLVQKYAICKVDEKLNILYSFLKTHLKCKILVFVSSCKQVSYIYEVFKRLQPGIIVSCLHGRQKQFKRLEVFDEFYRKPAICLISTDIASRGLDFPVVDWVLQLDCPEDSDTYVHRVGRTARYNNHGNSILLLTEKESEHMVETLHSKRIPIKKTTISKSNVIDITPHLLAFCSQSPEVKYLAQRAIVSYVRAVHLRKDKKIFDVFSIPLIDLCKSYGLENVPNIKILKSQNNVKNVSRDLANPEDHQESVQKYHDIILKSDTDVISKINLKNQGMSDNSFNETPSSKFRKLSKMYSRKNTTVLSDHYRNLIEEEPDDDDANEILVLKEPKPGVEQQLDHDYLGNNDVIINDKTEVRAAKHRKIIKMKKTEIKNRGRGKHTVFDSEGNEVKLVEFKTLESFEEEMPMAQRREQYINDTAKVLEKEDIIDKEKARMSLRLKKSIKKHKRKRHETDQ